jgi:flagellar hook-length control protein FliK
MELVASLPPDVAAIADPAARAPASPLRPPAKDDAAAAAAAPFDLLLALLTTPLPGGESLPAGGNALPAAGVSAACDSTAPPKPVAAAPQRAATGADLLARLKLAAAPAAADESPAPRAQPTDVATAALPFADLDLPSTADVAANVVVPTPPTPQGPAAQAQAASGPGLAAALEAALPQAAGEEPAPRPVRVGQVRDTYQAAPRSAATAVATDLRAAQASPVAAPTPVGEVADAATRPVGRDATLEALAPPTPAPPSADAQASPAAAAPALAPLHSHSQAAATATLAQAPAAQGGPIDIRSDHWHEALASRVQVLVDQHLGEAHIKLNPPELGAVDIKISLVDDKTFVQLTAGTPAARDELSQSLPRLRELLSAGGLSLGGASVHGGSPGQGGQESAPRVASPAYRPFAAPDDDELEPVRAAARAVGRIDLFA